MGRRDSGKSGETDDAALWARVAETTAPLKKGGKPRPPPKPRGREEPDPATPAPKPTARPQAAPKPGPAPEGLDRQTARKLERGRLVVEARLDLHGMKQRDAHAALRRFLKSAQGRGARHVLVITGKGAPRETQESFYEEEARGVLRQAVPHWLAQPDLAPLIVSVAEAPRRLGGEGALYVRLRKPRG